MRLVLGVLAFTCLSAVACSGGSSQGIGGSSGGSPTTPPETCADGSTPAPEPPAPTSIDGTGPLTGDGEVRGSAPVRPGGCADEGERAAAPEASGSAGAPSGSSSSGGSSGSSGSGGDATSSGGATSGGGGATNVGAGILTAGAWDDNRNFQRFLSYREQVFQENLPGLLPIDVAEHQAANAAAQPGAKQKLDVSLVIDTTGSMGDEIAYLQKEFDALAATIQAKFPGAEQRWSLVVYKDDTDDYVVRWYDFRANTGEFRAKLAAQSAGGGGDFPEAADRAVDVGTRLSWRTDANVARLMFWVADAPHHAGTEQKLANAIRSARNKGIHIYPVASSGIDELTELSMRSAAQITGGRYLFLTDDSGVGGAHKEPKIPCFFVTKLDKAILRMVDVEMTGAYREPEAADVLRTGGNPQSGVCQLEGGQQATIY
ncbi:MAG: VWA domain-containing protein [Labilithrix sp.]|nr:VWA domain-containing protein [Labilithrix sp.]MBX3221322.1 VWA domain-containing protein [Labilithrix sp.]